MKNILLIVNISFRNVINYWIILKDAETKLCEEPYPETGPEGNDMESPACEADECLLMMNSVGH